MMKNIALSEALYAYLLDVSVHDTATLKALREETAQLPLGIMQIAPEQGQFMQWLIRLIQAKKVLELGTFTGYSALVMAMALPDDGELITCDLNPTWTPIAERYWQQAHQKNKIKQYIGPALETIKNLLNEGYEHQFDFIFIDADKTNYVHYYELALQLISKKGIIAIDNVLWGGKVIDAEITDGQTREIRKLNALIKSDNRVDISMLGIADGLLLIRLKD
jgi:predicted O-methyltransferase YrrM